MSDELLESAGEEPEAPPALVPDMDDPRHLIWLSMQLGHAQHYIERLESRIEALEAELANA